MTDPTTSDLPEPDSPATRPTARDVGAPNPAAAAPSPYAPSGSAPSETVLSGLTAQDFEATQRSPEFQALRGSFRRFAFPFTVAFLVWYLAYVLLSTYAVGFMSTPVIGHVNLGLLISLGQFVTTFLITWLYVRHANRTLDPQAAAIRHRLEAGEV